MLADSESALIHSIIVQHSFLITHAFQSFSCLSLVNPLFFSIHAASLQKTFWQITNLHDNFLRERKGEKFPYIREHRMSISQAPSLQCVWCFFGGFVLKLKKKRAGLETRGKKSVELDINQSNVFLSRQKRMLEWDSLFSGYYFV